jgi:hypothetical protein
VFGFGHVSDAHALSTVDSGVIIIPPHEFDHPSCWCYKLQEVKKYECGVVVYGITSIPNFINFRPAILVIECVQTGFSNKVVRLGKVRLVMRIRRREDHC